MRARFALLVLLGLATSATALTGCGGDDPATTGDEANLIAGGLGSTRIRTAAEFDQLASPNAGGVLPGRGVKFLVDARTATKKAYFVNANFKRPDGTTPDEAKYHYFFAKKVLKNFHESIASFDQKTYWTQQKKFFAGTVQTYFVNGEAEPLYGIQFYPQDVIHEQTIVDALAVVTKAFAIPGARIAFVALGSQQTTAEPGIAEKIGALGVENTTIDKILGDVRYLPMNQGEAWGYLRVFPTNPDELEATDIPVFDELPLDLTVVAGTMTRAFQDPTCHVNLKSKERGTPNMVLRDASKTHERLAPFDGKPVHLTIGLDDFTLEPSTDEEVRQKLEERLGDTWTPLPHVPATDVLAYAEMCPGDPSRCLALAKGYGSKATNLGFLTNPRVLGRHGDVGSPSADAGYDLVPPGVGVPLQYYRDFLDHPANSELKALVDQLVADVKAGGLPAAELNARIAEVQGKFLLAPFPEGMVERIRTGLVAAAPGVVKFKARSSANAEDLPKFDGAGLYASYSINLNKTDNADGSCKLVPDTEGGESVETKLEVKPKTLACGIKAVYASVWNRRAIDERSYARLDHATALMGIALVPKYDLEAEVAANAVAVTRVIGSNGVYGYTFSSQQGNNLVTNPTPGTISETTIAAFIEGDPAPSFVVTRYATPVAGQPPLTTPVLTEAQQLAMLRIASTAERAYCRAKPGYFPGGDCDYVAADPQKPTALDFEFKILENGKFVAKQMREFSGH